MYTPLNPTFIYSKTGVCRDIPIFLMSAQKNIGCGYSLEPPRHRTASPRRSGSVEAVERVLDEAVLTFTNNLCFEQK